MSKDTHIYVFFAVYLNLFVEIIKAADKYRSDQVSAIVQTHIRYKSYQKQTMELSHALELSNDPALVSLAMESGEISLVEFFYETDLYYRVLNELLLAEIELYMAEAELTKFDFLPSINEGDS